MTDHQTDGDEREFISGVVEGFYGRPWDLDQRRELFRRLKELGMNTYMYAPKDDCKHRTFWRQLYSRRELEQLRLMIKDAELNDIVFYYSLSPGLDMVYSNSEDINALTRKFDQLVSIGCKSFAILFDDIDPSIGEKDREVFENYAAAQVSVTNLIYNHLNQPKFLFCPTEYCESRAIPNVPNSAYLNTIGRGLNKKIDILWSGVRVISRYITEESLVALSKVIRRPPVIWENLHANDYDKKRVFLGPYTGRSTKIKSKLRGILLNPNCEYELNYIAIHTMSQWLKCSGDINQFNTIDTLQLSMIPNTEIYTGEESLSESIYDPQRALIRAIKDWVPKFREQKALPPGFIIPGEPRDDAAIQASIEGVNMMVPDDSDSSTDSKSDMELVETPPPNRPPSIDSFDSCEMMDVKSIASFRITEGHEFCCVDLFYLPFEHGARGFRLLHDVIWLLNNGEIVREKSSYKEGEEGFSREKEKDESKEEDEDKQKEGESGKAQEVTVMSDDDINAKKLHWFEQFNKLKDLCIHLNRIVNTIISECPNKALVSELYPYLMDIKAFIHLIIDYFRYLRYRDAIYFRFSVPSELKQKSLFCSTEDEPWVHRGGILGDLQRLFT